MFTLARPTLQALVYARGTTVRNTSHCLTLLSGIKRSTPVVSHASMAISSASDQAVQGLEPQALWLFFKDLTQTPRPSKHEEKVLSYLKNFAENHGLQYRQDSMANIVITRPGSGGGERAPTVVIQSHVDMVCEKNDDVAHDFLTDPLRLTRQGDWLKAQGTTLGADNGIGVATALALLSLPPSAKLPPLECLFTVDEETGLTGAYGISPSLLQGRTMLNLDTEEWGEVFIGCAGGGDSQLHMTLPLELAPQGAECYMLRVSGLMGGHSGLNIHEDRGNAVQMMARLVAGLAGAAPGLRMVQAKGGDKRNAIPREAWALVMVLPDQVPLVHQLLAAKAAELKEEYGDKEVEMEVALTRAEDAQVPWRGHVLTPAAACQLTDLLLVLPHGPLKFSHTVPGLVETSNNVASVACAPATSTPGSSPCIDVHVVTSTRSSMAPALEAVRDRIAAVARRCGASMQRGQAYPGWKPQPASPVLQVVREAYRSLLSGQEPKVGALHAGLECGILGEKFPGMDMVSFGPTIRGAHSPDEMVQISSVESFWRLTLKVLESLADRRGL